MRQFFGVLVQIAGWIGAIWSLTVGLSFSGLFLLGVITDGWREAGRSLPWMLAFTVVAPLLSYGVVLLGRRLSKVDTEDTRNP